MRPTTDRQADTFVKTVFSDSGCLSDGTSNENIDVRYHRYIGRTISMSKQNIDVKEQKHRYFKKHRCFIFFFTTEARSIDFF